MQQGSDGARPPAVAAQPPATDAHLPALLQQSLQLVGGLAPRPLAPLGLILPLVVLLVKAHAQCHVHQRRHQLHGWEGSAVGAGAPVGSLWGAPPGQLPTCQGAGVAESPHLGVGEASEQGDEGVHQELIVDNTVLAPPHHCCHQLAEGGSEAAPGLGAQRERVLG